MANPRGKDKKRTPTAAAKKTSPRKSSGSTATTTTKTKSSRSSSSKQEESQQLSTQESSQEGMTTSAEGSQEMEDTQQSVFLDSQPLSQDTQDTQEIQDEGQEESDGEKSSSKKKKKLKKPEVQISTERDTLERAPFPPTEDGGTKMFTILSWNVNGIRATVKNGLEALRSMVKTERPDLVCFQETKLQEKDVKDLRAQDILPGYDSAWTCSTVKKGYAGQAVFFPKQKEKWMGSKKDDASAESQGPPKKKQKQATMSAFFKPKEPALAAAPAATVSETTSTAASSAASALCEARSGVRVLGVTFGINDTKHDGEGRSITVEYEKCIGKVPLAALALRLLMPLLPAQFFVVTLYVPNSGQKLERLSYRTKEWDPALRSYVEKLEGEGKPVIVTGDLNVAHLDNDIYNVGAKHLEKTAGTTKEERESFDAWLKRGKVVDAFRQLHPDARGAYTYWSVRTNARPVNKGLRLDYFLCSSSVCDREEDTAVAMSTSERVSGRKHSKGQGDKNRNTGASCYRKTGVRVHDCYQLEKATVGISDHCPIGLVLRNV